MIDWIARNSQTNDSPNLLEPVAYPGGGVEGAAAPSEIRKMKIFLKFPLMLILFPLSHPRNGLSPLSHRTPRNLILDTLLTGTPCSSDANFGKKITVLTL